MAAVIATDQCVEDVAVERVLLGCGLRSEFKSGDEFHVLLLEVFKEARTIRSLSFGPETQPSQGEERRPVMAQ